jgi:phosphatidylglycerophosphate synthase
MMTTKRIMWVFGIFTTCHFVVSCCVLVAAFLNGFSFGAGPSGRLWDAWCTTIGMLNAVLSMPAHLIGPTKVWLLVLMANSIVWGVVLTIVYVVIRMLVSKRKAEPTSPGDVATRAAPEK